MKIVNTKPGLNCRRTFAHRGSVLVYSMFLLIVMLSLSSLSVDYACVLVVKTQAQLCADAAALAGAEAISTTTGTASQIAAAISAAQQVGAQNTVNGKPGALLTQDIQVGNWDTTQAIIFSPSRLPLNAVIITVNCTAARQNGVPLLMMSTFGVTTCDVHATSTAYATPPSSTYGIVGINHLNFSSLGVLASVTGDMASNGNVNVGYPLGLLVGVSGDAKSFEGAVSQGTLAAIGGSTSPLSSSLYYPPVQVPTTNNNSNISQYLDSQNNFLTVGLAVIPAGTYVVHDLNMLASVSMQLQGPVTFYVTGAANIAAAANLLGNTSFSSSNLNIKVASGGSVNFLANLLVPLNMNLYAPQSAISINVGVNSYSGELIGQTLDVNLPILGRFKEVKPASTPPQISLVQ